jgi:XapX domain-containing protein
MKVHLISFAFGILVGVLYGVLNVRSPAPPVVALIGLLGILLGEQVPPIVKHLHSGTPASVSWLRQIKLHVFGRLPAGHPSGEELRSADRSIN